MLIESIIQRAKGTKVSLRADYHFLPGPDGRHVAEVEDEADIVSLLAIKEGYRAADGRPIATPELLEELDGPFFILRGPQDMEALHHWMLAIPDMQNQPSEFVLLVDKIAFGEASLGGFALPTDVPHLFESPAPVDGGETPAVEPSPPPPAPNSILPTDQSQSASPADDPGSGPQAAGDGGAGAAGGVGADTPPVAGELELDREALAKEYDELVGHRPNGKWSAEKIALLIEEKKAEG